MDCETLQITAFPKECLDSYKRPVIIGLNPGVRCSLVRRYCQRHHYVKTVGFCTNIKMHGVNVLVENVDAYRSSAYLHKDRDSRNTKLIAGPVWDFNLAFGNVDYHADWLVNGLELEISN